MTNQHFASAQQEPVLRNVKKVGDKYFERAVFYKATGRAAFKGYIDLLGEGRIAVTGFINNRKDGSDGKVISLNYTHIDQRSGEITHRTVALGNVVNRRGDGDAVYYDTVIFNAVDDRGERVEGAEAVAVWITDACDAEFHQRLGFEQPRITRPPREEDDDGDLEQLGNYQP